MKPVYFRNLGALRFFAATAVILHHVEQYKYWAGIPGVWGNESVDALGTKAVSFFFVLSGFLITYLLLEEHRRTSDISIRDFYIRRILRIWPLYYLIVILCLVVVPLLLDQSFLSGEWYGSNFMLKAVLLLLVMPNVMRVFSPNLIGGNQLWSIGVEEQFYIMWPLFIRAFIRRVFFFLAMFIVAKVIVTLGLLFYADVNGGKLANSVFRFWILFKVEQMAIGGIGAWILFHQRQALLQIIYHRVTWWLALAALLLLFVVPSMHWSVSYLEAPVFLIIILNLSTNAKLRISLEHPMLTAFGNMSYGIYMYHTLCIAACLYLLMWTGKLEPSGWAFNVILYVGSIALTLTVAYFSYHYFETFFLRFKEKFALVKSGRKDVSDVPAP